MMTISDIFQLKNILYNVVYKTQFVKASSLCLTYIFGCLDMYSESRRNVELDRNYAGKGSLYVLVTSVAFSTKYVRACDCSFGCCVKCHGFDARTELCLRLPQNFLY